jgi:ribosome-binding protein aMBF1 (putative translation factor)
MFIDWFDAMFCCGLVSCAPRAYVAGDDSGDGAMAGDRQRKASQALARRFGAALRRRRERAGLSQEQLAHRVGVHRTYVGAVERGEKNVTLGNMARLAKGVGTRASVLLELRSVP